MRNDWPGGLVGSAVHVVTQGGYRLAEGVAIIFGKRALRLRSRALRKGESLHWRARLLAKRGDYEEALRAARRGLAALRESNPQETYPVFGGVLAVLLDDLSEQVGRPDEVLPELRDVLQVFGEMRRKAGESPALDQVVTWLEERVAAPRA